MARRKFRERLEAVAHFIDLPPEAVAGSVGVHVVGASHCTVENFKYIPVLTDNLIKLVCRDFTVHITGENMVAHELSEGMVVLRGRICSISYEMKNEFGGERI